MQRFALYYHVGSGNRGCEALVQSTSDMLYRRFGKIDVTLYSERSDEDENSCYAHVDRIRPAKIDVPLTLTDRARLKLLQQKSDYDADLYFYRRMLPVLPAGDHRVFLSVGGDTYCYGENRFMYAFNAQLKKQGIRTVLWGCSLDEGSFSEHNAADLRTYDAIFARDTGTYTMLREKGFSQHIYQHPDPAFTLQSETLPLPEGFREGNTIGINASPLVFRYEGRNARGIGMRSYEALIEWILSQTDQTVMLVPHVFWDFSDDRSVLRPLYDKYADTGRILMLDGMYSASQIKGYIARCRAFIGARTHSTIAAYSSMVPTLVLGYSVKSVNIALDLFGKTDGFVVPINRLEDEMGLAHALRAMLDREQLHRVLLQERVPQYIQRAEAAADTLENVLLGL